MKWPDGKPYYSLNQYYTELFGKKTYKIALDIGSTCPNRDGTLGDYGCIFCGNSGSGDFASHVHSDIFSSQAIHNAITQGIQLIGHKSINTQYVAYLQSFTNTYGDSNHLTKIYKAIIDDPRICALSIGTRPDCLQDDLLKNIQALNRIKPIFIELGLQSIHKKSATWIRREYDLPIYDQALSKLKQMELNVVVHLIAGLPDESIDDFLQSVRYVAKSGASGIKLQMLHILKSSSLGKEYPLHPFDLLTFDEYVQWIVKTISILPPHMVVHRITGDGNKDDMIAPKWSLNKRKVLNAIHSSLASNDLWQGYYNGL